MADWDSGRPRAPIEAMSATKSIVNLAIGRLVAVRQRRYCDGTNPEDPKTTFGDFTEMVAAPVPAKPGR